MNDEPSDSAAAASAWSLLWRDDRLDACSTGNAAALESIEAAWRDRFSVLDAGSRLLDLATGNGALAWRALRTAAAQGRHIDVHGVDLADIDPHRVVRGAGAGFAGIRFHPRTPLEALPFPTAHFDAACSQFGLEYSDTARSVPELARVLRPGAPLWLLLHTHDSVLRQGNAAERASAQRLLDSPVFPALDSYVEAVAAEPWTPGAPLSGRLQVAIDALSRALAQADSERPGGSRALADDVLSAIRRLVASSVDLEAGTLRAQASDLRRRLQAQVTRFVEMERASLSAADLARLERRLVAAGMEAVHIRPALAGGPPSRLGVWVEARRGDVIPE